MQRTEEQVERTIGVMLRVGVLTSATVVLAGGLWHLARHGMTIPDYRTFRGEPQGLRSISGVWGGVLRLEPRSVIQLGLLLLIATPIARVAFSVAAFAVQRDRVYVGLSALVLAVLLWSLSGAGYSPH